LIVLISCLLYVNLTPIHLNHHQAIWKFDKVTGEVVSSLFRDDGGDTCLTTGWPFLQVGAYIEKEGKKRTIIVLNEASDPANYIIRGDDNEIMLTNSIPAHSIQTLVL
jgi:glucosylceramidase